MVKKWYGYDFKVQFPDETTERLQFFALTFHSSEIRATFPVIKSSVKIISHWLKKFFSPLTAATRIRF